MSVLDFGLRYTLKILLLVGLSAGLLNSYAPAQKDRADVKDQTTPQGMVVVRDPESGLFRSPTAEEREKLGLNRFFRMSAKELRLEVRSDGTLRVVLDDRFSSALVATGGRGGLKVHCVEGRASKFRPKPVIGSRKGTSDDR
jgi:hypothetical protein